MWFYKYQKNSSGMTLIEAMVAIGITLAALLAITSSILYVYRANTFALEEASAVTSARRGVERATRDIREVAYSDEGAYPVVTMSSTTLTFYSDIDKDDSVERLRYFLDGTSLKRGLTEASGNPPRYDLGSEIISEVSDNVRNDALGIPLFTYFDVAGETITDYLLVSAVRFVTVRLVVNVNPTKAPNDFELRSSATLRNLID